MTRKRDRSVHGSRFRVTVTALGLALSCFASNALADTPPSVWERARNAGIGDSYRLHLEVQRRLSQVEPRDFGFSGPHESQKDTVRAMLERMHAEKSPDVRLRFDLGLVYLLLGKTEERSYYVRAAEILGDALSNAPNHPAAEEGWSRLAEACGHIGDHPCERRAYNAALRLTTEEADRGTPTLNLAETEMHLGNLKEALDGYQEALRIASRSLSSHTLAPLAMWGLAVALDRSGDRVGSEKQALAVLELQASSGLTGLLRSSGVFFYPDYELNWYDAVGASALARKATAPADVARYWRVAEQAFANYVHGAQRADAATSGAHSGAVKETDRWLELAKVRLTAAKLERERAEKKRGKATPPPTEDDETPL